ncbi:spore germination protein [Pelosinus sp. sgz500959]|uniref:spore germination protein n=1 Tax=Pelosinus sp. sgz500959 TaxID=3242472 RepID=UPI00366F9A31
MGKNAMQKIYTNIKNILVYQPTRQPDPFVLDETQQDGKKTTCDLPQLGLLENFQQFEANVRYARRLSTFLEKLIEVFNNGQWFDKAEELKKEYTMLEKQQTEISVILVKENSNLNKSELAISTSLEENQKMIETIYQLPLNKDVVIRKLMILDKHEVKAMLVFMDGLADKKIVNMTVLQPLMLMRYDQEKPNSDDLVNTIIEQCLPSGQASRVSSFKEVEQGINTGDAVLFFEGIKEAVTVETKGFEHRGVDRPATEQSVRGSQNAFTEVLRVNTALIRSMLHSSDLITEMIPVGKRGHSNCAIMYLKSVANQELVAEVRRRIKGIDTDLIIDAGVLESMIIDFPQNPFPQTLSTERPDRVVVHLAEGRVAFLLDGSPFGHVVPVSIFTLMHSADDFAMHFYYSNFLRMIRWMGGFISMLLPGIYLAISTFHQETIPTELLLSITAARAQVPFPAFVEIILMEFSFELIREGGLRIPGILGSTLGIVGAIILGQAAVSAKIVSPIMVIVIAVTGLASYSIPEYRLASTFRLLRLIYIILAVSMGLVGMACGFLVFTAVLCSLKSFGMPYLAPVAPKTIPGGDIILRKPVHLQQKRADELNPQDVIRQGTVSRPWTEETPIGGDES